MSPSHGPCARKEKRRRFLGDFWAGFGQDISPPQCSTQEGEYSRGHQDRIAWSLSNGKTVKRDQGVSRVYPHHTHTSALQARAHTPIQHDMYMFHNDQHESPMGGCSHKTTRMPKSFASGHHAQKFCFWAGGIRGRRPEPPCRFSLAHPSPFSDFSIF